ncbi:MAG TPA: hypothetical protein VM841_10990 [Actinomycetota bacterium]|nr:hypothetical protein [Actinomycetota bacterium]
MRRGLVVALVAATACTPAVSPESGPDPVPTISGSPAPATGLAALLFDEAPPGYVVVPEETRAVTLDEAVEGSDDPDEARARLSTHGFVSGFTRTWTKDDDAGNVIYAFVYEFATEEGAQADMNAGLGEARRDGSETFDVPGIEGAIGVTKAAAAGAEGDDSTFHAVFFVRGKRLYLVAIGGPTEPSHEQAVELAKRMDVRAR